MSRLFCYCGVITHKLFFSTLLQLAKTSCGRVILCLFMMAALVGCENPDIPESSPRMKELYFESCNLTMVQTDSIPRFANKFNNYITQNPEERKDPFYPDIRANIYDAADKAGILVGSLLINTEWDGESHIEF